MSDSLLITGYSGQVWSTALATLSYYNSNIDPSNIESAQTLTYVVASSMKNGITLLDSNQDMQQIYNNYILLTEAFAVPVTIDSTDATYIENRLNGMLAFAGNVTLFQIPLGIPSSTIPKSTPPLPDPGYLEYVLGFTGEVPPAGLTSNNFIATATAAANAWGVLALALASTGLIYSGAAYQAVLNMQNCSLAVIQNLTSANYVVQGDLTALWNQLVAVPAYLTLASLTGNDPTSLQSQNVNTAKFVMGSFLNSFNQSLVSLRQQASGNIQLTTVRQGETLMDIAARTLGNFESWQQIAALNNLLPPYITATATSTTTAPGQQIFLPTSGSVQSTGAIPVYSLNYLGVDLYYGPLNQDMLPWNGDFNTVAGYNNLSISLGRRLQTSIGDLIYHTEFGSRIPPLIGTITSQNELNVIQAYAQSALMSDPRVNTVVTSAAAYVGYAISVTATVTPNGFSGSSNASATVNEVIR